MLLICKKCGSENRQDARFCDHCGAAFIAEAVPADAADTVEAPSADPAAAAPALAAANASGKGFWRETNWTAIVLMAIVIALIAYLVIPPAKPEPAPSNVGESSEDGLSSAPDSAEQQGEAAGGEEMMQQVLGDIAGIRERLAADPGNLETLRELYQIYATVGKQAELTQPLTDYVAAVEKDTSLDAEARKLKIVDAMDLAMQFQHPDGLRIGLEGMQRQTPDDMFIIQQLGNISFDLDEPTKAIEWYDLYLSKSTEQDEAYWNVRIDRDIMYLRIAEHRSDRAALEKAIANLEEVTKLQPQRSVGWYQLGQAHKLRLDPQAALQAFNKALEVATDDIQRWQAESEIAKLNGDPAPAMPANPHSEGMMMGNPHGEMGH